MSENKNIEVGHSSAESSNEGSHIRDYANLIAFFRDQKSDAHFQSEGSPEEYGNWMEQQQSKESNREEDQNVRTLQDTMDKINQAELEDGYIDSEKQKELLEKKKEEVRAMIYDLLNKIKEYLERVTINVRAQNSSKEAENYSDVLLETDKNRSRAHNTLLDALRIVIRNISYNFANIDAAALEKWEDHLDKHGQEMLMIKRQDFPSKIICPDFVDINDRNAVAQWASKLRNALNEPSEKK